MRLPKFCLLSAAAAAFGFSCVPADAQSAFQRGFGLGNAGRYSALRSAGRFRHFDRDRYFAQSRSQAGGGYRTLCVRLCDGYYWPVSSSASRSKFYRDAAVCRSSCDHEARLFYLPRGSDDIGRMTDLTGLAYGRLPEAFAYRKTLDGACACKPDPWSDEALARHRAYADLEAEKERVTAARDLTNFAGAVTEHEPEAVAIAEPVAEIAEAAVDGAIEPPLADAAEVVPEMETPNVSTEVRSPARTKFASRLRPGQQRTAVRGGPPRRGLMAW